MLLILRGFGTLQMLGTIVIPFYYDLMVKAQYDEEHRQLEIMIFGLKEN